MKSDIRKIVAQVMAMPVAEAAQLVEILGGIVDGRQPTGDTKSTRKSRRDAGTPRGPRAPRSTNGTGATIPEPTSASPTSAAATK